MPNAGNHVPMVVYNPGKIKKGFEYNEIFEFSDFLPTFAHMAGVPVPENIDGTSFHKLFNGESQPSRETIFVHYDPLKAGNAGITFYGRFVRNKQYKLYNDGRFYNVGNDPLEQTPLQNTELSAEVNGLMKTFQAELDAAPEHHFKQNHEYKKN